MPITIAIKPRVYDSVRYNHMFKTFSEINLKKYFYNL